MQSSINVVAIIALLISGASIAQDGEAATSEKSWAGRMLVLDANKHRQMEMNGKEREEHLQALKQCTTHESGKGGYSNRAAAAIAHQRASEEEIEALQRSVKQLRHQLEASPHYLEQMNQLLP